MQTLIRKKNFVLSISGKIILLGIILFLSLPVFSQRFSGGLLSGFNGSQVRGSISRGFHKLGFVGGVWVQTDISEKFYWGGEIKYSQKGSRINPTMKNPNLFIYRLNYIDMPLLIGYKYNDDFSFFSGLSFGYLINGSVEDNYGVYSNFDYSDLHNFEIGMFVGLKVDFNRIVDRDWARKLMLDFRYQFSAMSIYKGNNLFFYYSPYGQYNSVISTSLYYTIDFGAVNR